MADCGATTTARGTTVRCNREPELTGMDHRWGTRWDGWVEWADADLEVTD